MRSPWVSLMSAPSTMSDGDVVTGSLASAAASRSRLMSERWLVRQIPLPRHLYPPRHHYITLHVRTALSYILSAPTCSNPYSYVMMP